MPNPVIHFEIITKDPRKLAQFYNSAFDWNIDTSSPESGAGNAEYFMVKPTGEDMPSHSINGGFGAPMDGYEGHVTFYIHVDDVEQALRKVEQLGATRMMGPETVAQGGPIIGLFRDPLGNTVGLVHVDM